MNDLPLICIGGGGHCKSVISVAERVGYKIMGILDVAEKVGLKTLNYPIIGTDDDIEKYSGKAQFIITVGHIKNPNLRMSIYERILKSKAKIATIIADTAVISPYAKIGEGTVILNHAAVNADAVIGTNCIINTFSNIEHDAEIGDFTHISTGAMVNGNCTVGARTFIGSGTVLVNGISVPSDSVIAAGSLVRKTFIDSGVYSGHPARLMIRNK